MRSSMAGPIWVRTIALGVEQRALRPRADDSRDGSASARRRSIRGTGGRPRPRSRAGHRSIRCRRNGRTTLPTAATRTAVAGAPEGWTTSVVRTAKPLTLTAPSGRSPRRARQSSRGCGRSSRRTAPRASHGRGGACLAGRRWSGARAPARTHCASSSRNGTPPKWSPWRWVRKMVSMRSGSTPMALSAVIVEAPQSRRQVPPAVSIRVAALNRPPDPKASPHPITVTRISVARGRSGRQMRLPDAGRRGVQCCVIGSRSSLAGQWLTIAHDWFSSGE